MNGASSAPREVLSGVPQGSVLGSLLFLVLLGNIDEVVNWSFLSSIADDTRLGKAINNLGDCSRLQTDLNAVYFWAKKNNTQFNSDKFECIKYGQKKGTTSNTLYTTPDGKTIKEKNIVKDLGVRMCNNGTFWPIYKKYVWKQKNLAAGF